MLFHLGQLSAETSEVLLQAVYVSVCSGIVNDSLAHETDDREVCSLDTREDLGIRPNGDELDQLISSTFCLRDMQAPRQLIAQHNHDVSSTRLPVRGWSLFQ